MVKDFDFDIRKVGNKELIIVSGMESLEEAKWYKNIILTDKRFAGKNNLKNFNLVIVQEADFQAPGLGMAVLKIEVGVIDGMRHDLAEHLRQRAIVQTIQCQQDILIPKEIVNKKLKTTAEAIVEVNSVDRKSVV